jgi:hypothetical protein
MDKLPSVGSKVRFWGKKTKQDVLDTEFDGIVMGYGTVMGGLWKNEPEPVCLVETEDSVSLIAVSHKGMELLDEPLIF